MRAISKDFYGDETRWFVGVVEQHVGDPLDLGRIKVRVFGIHSASEGDVGLDDLPWCPVVMPITDPGVPGFMNPHGIQTGARVFGIFLDGKHSQTPMVVGSMPHSPDHLVDFPVDDPFTSTINRGAGVSQGTATTARKNGKPGVTVRNIELGPGSFVEQCFDFLYAVLIEKGSKYPAEQAAGLVGNFMQETFGDCDPNTYEFPNNKSRGGFGIAQWTASRRRSFEAYCAEQGTGQENLEVQLNFVIEELERKPISASMAGLFKRKTIEEATEYVFLFYETPQTAVDYNKLMRPDKYGPFLKRETDSITEAYLNELNERIGDARSVYNKFYRGGGN